MTNERELLERAGALRFQAERVSVPETREKFLKEANEIEKSAKEIAAQKKKEHKGKLHMPSVADKIIGKKYLTGRIVSKSIVKETSRPTIIMHKQKPLLSPMERDKSRFFKETWEQERRNLFLS